MNIGACRSIPMLDRLSLAFADCHCEGKVAWELTGCKDEGKVTLR